MRAPASSLFLLLLGAVFPLPLHAQTSISHADRVAEIKQLFSEERWNEIVRVTETETARSADLNYYYGIALARLERWEEAKKAFQSGFKQRPHDKRFPLELAGVLFKQKEYSEAKDYLRRALRLDSTDPHATDFLASVYFLQGNLEAALKYWNRINKPQVEEMRLDPTPRLDPVLLDRSFAFAPASTLRLSELETTKARIGGLNIFPAHRFDLEALPDEKFDVIFRGRERNGWGASRWEGLLSLFRGLPFQTIHPEFFNIRRRATNFVSMVRWDREKQRLWTNLSGPFSGSPKWRYCLDLDLRDENWDVPESVTDSATDRIRLSLNKQAFAMGLTSFAGGRWEWSTGVEFSHRDFRGVILGNALTPQLLTQGFQLKHKVRVNHFLVRAPEKRFSVIAGASTQLGRIWSKPSHVFGKLGGSLQARWFPKPSGDDYEMQARIRVGNTFGEIPFDELFALGVERDNDLWLRAHVGTRNGRKGNAPMGRSYLLSNWEVDKNVYNNGLVKVQLGPFFDTGKITDPAGVLGSQRWLWDLGAQAKVRVLGVGIAFSYGRDLRTGRDSFYVSMLR